MTFEDALKAAVVALAGACVALWRWGLGLQKRLSASEAKRAEAWEAAAREEWRNSDDA